MNKGLDLIQRQQPEIIDDYPTGNIFIGVTREELTELEKELEEKAEQDVIINAIKEVIEFNICEPKFEKTEEGLSFTQQIVWRQTRELTKKELETYRSFILNKCFPKELKALEIIKEKGIILQFIKETYTVEQYNAGVFGTLVKPLTKEEYDLLREVLL